MENSQDWVDPSDQKDEDMAAQHPPQPKKMFDMDMLKKYAEEKKQEDQPKEESPLDLFKSTYPNTTLTQIPD